MIKFVFDRLNLPNLVKDESIKKGTKQWWDLCITEPYSYEFRFLTYCRHENVAVEKHTISTWDGKGSAYYPVNINFFDHSIDYFSLMEKSSYQALVDGKLRFLLYYSEGDDPYEFMTDRIKKLCVQHNINRDHVQIISANWYVRKLKNWHYFPDDELYYKYLQTVDNQINYVTDINLKPRQKAYTCLIRADKLWRKTFAYNLFHHPHQRYLSYLNYKYETSAFDESWDHLTDEYKQKLISFDLQLPLRCDDTTDAEANNHKLINKEFYTNAYWNFVVETHFGQPHTTFLTEKTFKPILNLQPFIIIGCPESLSLLKFLGYKTFGHIINENYDIIKDTNSRMSKCIKLCLSVADLPLEQQQKVIEMSAGQVRHNQRRFLSSKQDRILTLLEKLEY
jgi:hypothetical protein